jgi:hypothetical protein
MPSMAVAVGAGDLAEEDDTTWVSVAFSSRISTSSSESLRMMILLSPGSPRTSRLISPKCLLANSSSRETSVMRSPSSEDEKKSTTRVFSDDPPCSHIGERGQREETSGGDVNGDPEGAGGGVLAPSGDGLPSLEGERACLMPLLSFIDYERRVRKVNPKQERKNCEMVISVRRRRYL